jgi:hypothetical protein
MTEAERFEELTNGACIALLMALDVLLDLRTFIRTHAWRRCSIAAGDVQLESARR